MRKESDDKIIQTSDYNEYDSSIVDTNERAYPPPISALSDGGRNFIVGIGGNKAGGRVSRIFPDFSSFRLLVLNLQG